MDKQLVHSPEIEHLISKEEIEQFYKLLKKMNTAISEIENITENTGLTDAHQGILPYVIEFTVNCSVSKKGASITISPELAAKFQNVYEINLTTDNYENLIGDFMAQITDTLATTCSKYIPKSENENE